MFPDNYYILYYRQTGLAHLQGERGRFLVTSDAHRYVVIRASSSLLQQASAIHAPQRNWTHAGRPLRKTHPAWLAEHNTRFLSLYPWTEVGLWISEHDVSPPAWNRRSIKILSLLNDVYNFGGFSMAIPCRMHVSLMNVIRPRHV
jgi:hypothetical protein